MTDLEVIVCFVGTLAVTAVIIIACELSVRRAVEGIEKIAPALPGRHQCGSEFRTTTAGDGVARCVWCYEEEARRGRFCGELWPPTDEVFPQRKQTPAKPVTVGIVRSRPLPTPAPGPGRELRR